MSTATTQVEILYPSGDGEPMAETGIHVQAIILLHQALEDFLRPHDADVFIASDMFWYYHEGDTNKKVAPDVMVVPKAGAGERRSYFSWRETVPVPAVVFEMASLSTWESDLEEKRALYQMLGVPEYFLFDPEEGYIRPPLQGYRLRNGVYVPIPPTADSLQSDLGFRLRAEGTMLRLLAADGIPVPTRSERIEQERRRADEANGRLDEERSRNGQLQAENDRLKELLKRLGHANGNGS